VFVGNLSFDVTRDELIEAFGAAGKVKDAKVPTDRETGRPRGFAFVEFETDEEAQKSIALLNGKDLKGRALRVNEAENRPPRPAGSMGPRPFGARPSGPPRGAPGGFLPPPPFDTTVAFEGKGRSARGKGSLRGIRRRKRGFE
jgi:RNA recognition motif-containing protein